MTTDFEHLQGHLARFLKAKNEIGELKLLNVGTDRPGECHWRFRYPSGEIVTVKMEVETNDGW